MGKSLSELPRIGNLHPRDARELARSLRMLIPRAETVSLRTLREFLQASAFASVSPQDIVKAGWLMITEDGRYSADTYERRLAAGAVDGNRMSFEEAAALVDEVRTRVARIDGYRGRVKVLRVVLYGSAARSTGNIKPDIGDLDLAIEVEVTSQELYLELSALPEEQQWRAAIERSGWDKVLMEGDDRVTVAGSLTRVLTLFNRQLHGLDLPPTEQRPCLVTIWQHPDAAATPPASTEVPALWRPQVEDDELDACQAGLLETLAFIEHRSIQEEERAQAIAERLLRQMLN
jgi:predicted nucleotidyltransferase